MNCTLINWRSHDPGILSFSWPLKFSSTSLQPKSILLFCQGLQYHTHSGILRKPDGIYRKPAQHHRNQDSDALQLEWRCVENTEQMFGLRIQNNMYLTLQFKKLNSNMCLVGFPENIESCCIKLNKHQAQLVPFSLFIFFLFLFKLSIFQIRKHQHVYGATGIHWLMPKHTMGIPCLLVTLYTFNSLSLCSWPTMST